MITKFNPTGTHIHKGFLKVRIDLYPEPTDKTYSIHHVQVPVIPPEGYRGKVDEMGGPVDIDDYKSWIDGLPKVWQTNPALSHFVKVDPDTVLDESFVKQVFDNPTVVEIDGALSKSSTTRVSQLMKTKGGSGRKVVSADIETINLTLSSLEVKV